MVMKVLRKRMKIVIWIAAISFVALIFLSWGMDITRRSPTSMLQRGIVGKVNGYIIRIESYREALRRAFMGAREEADTEIDALTSTLIEERVFEQVVQEVLLRQEIAKHGLTLSDAEIMSFIKSVPPEQLRSDSSFMTDGEFDVEKYRQVFQNPANLPWLIEYERYARESLPKQKLMLTVQSAARITDLEVADLYSRQNAKAKVRFLLVRPEREGEAIEPTEEELLKYYHDNATAFRMPETATLSYVHFSTTPSTSDSALAEQKINQAYEELKEGAGFSDLASQVSEDKSTAELGGLVGWIRKGEVVKAFEDAAFSMKPGQFSEPILSEYGWHIVRVDDRQADSVKVRHVLVRVNAGQETVDMAREAASLFREDALTMGFEAASVAHGVTVEETPPFSGQNNYVPTVGYSSAIRDFAFKSKPNSVSRILATGAGFYVLRLLDRKESHIPEFEALSDSIMTLVRLEKRMSTAEAVADSAKNALDQGTPMERVARNMNLEYGVSDEISVTTAYPDYPLELLGAASMLKEGTISDPIETEQGYYIIEVLERTSPDQEDFASVSSGIAGNLIVSKQRRVVEEWMTALRKKADIQDYRGEIYP